MGAGAGEGAGVGAGAEAMILFLLIFFLLNLYSKPTRIFSTTSTVPRISQQVRIIPHQVRQVRIMRRIIALPIIPPNEASGHPFFPPFIVCEDDEEDLFHRLTFHLLFHCKFYYSHQCRELEKRESTTSNNPTQQMHVPNCSKYPNMVETVQNLHLQKAESVVKT